MKKRFFIAVLCITLVVTNVCLAATTSYDSKLFTPEITNALGIKNWLSSGENRALLAFSLGVNAADDRVLGREDVLLAFMHNPTFVGKDSSSENLIAATITEKDMVIIYYSPSDKQAYAITLPNENGVNLGAITLERALSGSCSTYYCITEEEMKTCIQYIQSLL